MVTKNNKLGGENFVEKESVYYNDINDTFDDVYNKTGVQSDIQSSLNNIRQLLNRDDENMRYYDTTVYNVGDESSMVLEKTWSNFNKYCTNIQFEMKVDDTDSSWISARFVFNYIGGSTDNSGTSTLYDNMADGWWGTTDYHTFHLDNPKPNKKIDNIELYLDGKGYTGDGHLKNIKFYTQNYSINSVTDAYKEKCGTNGTVLLESTQRFWDYESSCYFNGTTDSYENTSVKHMITGWGYWRTADSVWDLMKTETVNGYIETVVSFMDKDYTGSMDVKVVYYYEDETTSVVSKTSSSPDVVVRKEFENPNPDKLVDYIEVWNRVTGDVGDIRIMYYIYNNSTYNTITHMINPSLLDYSSNRYIFIPFINEKTSSDSILFRLYNDSETTEWLDYNIIHEISLTNKPDKIDIKLQSETINNNGKPSIKGFKLLQL